MILKSEGNAFLFLIKCMNGKQLYLLSQLPCFVKYLLELSTDMLMLHEVFLKSSVCHPVLCLDYLHYHSAFVVVQKGDSAII
jgi:hypothetical protein